MLVLHVYLLSGVSCTVRVNADLRVFGLQKSIEKAMDIGDKADDVMDGLDANYAMDEFDKDIHCIMMDKCEGEAYDKIKGLQHKGGA